MIRPALNMLDKGYNVFVVEDACGTTSQAAQEAVLSRMAQAGAVRMTTVPTVREFQRDWACREHYDASWEFSRNTPAPMGWGSNTLTRWCTTHRSRQKNRRLCPKKRTEPVAPVGRARIEGRRGR